MNIVWVGFKRTVVVWRGKLPLLDRLPLVVAADLLTDLSAVNTALDQGFAQNLQVAGFLPHWALIESVRCISAKKRPEPVGASDRAALRLAF